MGKPQVGISSMWYEGNPCNMHLLNLAEHVKAGVVSTAARIGGEGGRSHSCYLGGGRGDQ